ncbi:hypothetical protein N7532_000413 [Penicillium argentinense]|uniref:Rhodopsin domain-containing protein n=1 Tax=Penicillium argentinense TaxID=1131581 RepID=A0A9W9G5L9_9EURO|nr:uncharacterized protein N7532_000413 [Penicillium argentinense]KAJ5112368.1 hypothetical protein N7532_000413 [Penicillium argentinense]
MDGHAEGSQNPPVPRGATLSFSENIYRHYEDFVSALFVCADAGGAGEGRGANCNERSFSNSCSLTHNTTCFCASDSRPAILFDCVESQCTTKEFFTTKRFYEHECSITPLAGPPEIHPSTLVPMILASIFFVARMVAKGSGLAGGWGWDDYTIIMSYASITVSLRGVFQSSNSLQILGLAIYIDSVYMIRAGFGRNIWDIDFPIITKFYKLFQALAVMYKIQISLAKISVVLFLLRIFQTPVFRYVSYALIGINAAIGITWAFVDSFRCTPTHLTWDGWTNEEPGKCINFINSILVNCLVNIFVDAIMILMPVYEVSKLQMPTRKKFTVALMFVVGSVLTIIAIIRVIVFWNNRWGINQTLGLYPLIHWSVIECQIAVLCACLPASRALIGRWFPNLLGSSRRTYGSTAPGNWSNNVNFGQDSKINKSVSYSVNYASRSHRDDSNSDVELVDRDLRLAR